MDYGEDMDVGNQHRRPAYERNIMLRTWTLAMTGFWLGLVLYIAQRVLTGVEP